MKVLEDLEPRLAFDLPRLIPSEDSGMTMSSASFSSQGCHSDTSMTERDSSEDRKEVSDPGVIFLH